MSGEDLSKLKIDKSVKAFQPKRRARTVYLGIAILPRHSRSLSLPKRFHCTRHSCRGGHGFSALPITDSVAIECKRVRGGPAKSGRGVEDYRPTR